MSPIRLVPHGLTYYSLDSAFGLKASTDRLYKTDVTDGLILLPQLALLATLEREMAKRIPYLLTPEERKELTELLNQHALLSQRVISLDEQLTREHEEDDEYYDTDEDDDVREAVLAVRRARVALNKWVAKRLGPERDLYNTQEDLFPSAPLLRLSNAGEESTELPSYDEIGEETLETEPNVADILDTPDEITTLTYIARHGHPKLTPEHKRSIRKLMDQCLILHESLKEVLG